MNITINFDPTNVKEIGDVIVTLNKLAQQPLSTSELMLKKEDAPLENGVIKAKKGAKTKEEEFDLDAALDGNLEDATQADDPEVEDEEKPVAKPAKKQAAKKLPSLSDMQKAFQQYASDNSRAEAGKILAKFKVKSVKDIKESDYEKVLGLLK